ncbi:MAG: hypothetical protein RIT45_2265 [Pseudomonadota bacterium]
MSRPRWPRYRPNVRSVFLFTWDVERSPMRDALAFADFDLSVYPIRDGRLLSPIVAPPQLAILEPEPERPVPPLLRELDQHPVVGRVPTLLVLDIQWVSSADRMPIHDFVLRGFRPSEALARAYRAMGTPERRPAREPLRLGRLTVDLDGFVVAVDGAPVALTSQEFALLAHLIQHPGRVQSRDVLLTRVWGRSYLGGARTVDIHVRRLRAKIGPAADSLQTVRGVGYKWA